MYSPEFHDPSIVSIEFEPGPSGSLHEEINKDSSNTESPDYGASFFKIAICLNKLGYNSDLINDFLSESKEQLSDYYESMNDWGYRDWDDVYSKLILR